MSVVEKPSIEGEEFAKGEAKREETKVDEVYQDEDADLTVVSSDGTHFKVHSFYLKAASPALRTMIQNCSPDSSEIRLTDDEIETAPILRLLLQLIYNKPFADFNSLGLRPVLRLIRLADKWDCATPLRIVGLHTAQALEKGSDAHHLFYYACALDDLESAHRLLPAAAGMTWDVPGEKEGPVTVHRHVPGASVLDVTSMAIHYVELLPRKYLHALLRGWRLKLPHQKQNWEAIANEFRDQVKVQNAEQ